MAAKAKGSVVGGRTTRFEDYAIRERARRNTADMFGWPKSAPGLRSLMQRGARRDDWSVTSARKAYNLRRWSPLGGHLKSGH